MTLPTPMPVGMPAPLGTPFPAPALPASFGIDPADAALQAAVPGLQPAIGAPTPVQGGSPGFLPYASAATATGLAALTGGAVTEDPRTWDPASATTQTDNALARIASVNPELAKSLAEQQGLTQNDQGGGGFFQTLMGGLGSILEVTHLDDVFELLSRPAKVLPEMIMDWGEESVWKNMGDALSGHSDVSWDDVLVEKLGMERNFFTAALGLVGDIALDPLTYIPLGRLASLGRETTSMTAGKAFVRGSYDEATDILSKATGKATAEEALAGVTDVAQLSKAYDIDATFRAALAQSAKTEEEALSIIANPTVQQLDEASARIFATSDEAAKISAEAQKGVMARVQQAMRGIDPDALPGVVNVAADTAASRGLRILQANADEAVRAAYRGNFAKAAGRLAETTGMSKSYADEVLKRWVKEGTSITPGFGRRAQEAKGLYTRGREAATQLGGYRFHLNIPVLGMRIAPKRILPRMVPMLDFSVGRRFFAGISGEMRLSSMVAKKVAGAVPEDLRLFAEKGFSGLMSARPQVARALSGGRFQKYGSALMNASEAMGGLTAKLSPHAAAMRMGGLGGLRAAQAARQLPGITETVVGDMQRYVTMDGKTVMTGKTAMEFRLKAFAGITDEAERLTLSKELDEWAGLFPPEAGNGTVDQMLRELPAGTLTPEEVSRARELEAKFLAYSDDGLEAAQSARMGGFQAEQAGMDHGIVPDVDRYGYDDMSDMTARDAQRYAKQSQHTYMHDTVYEVDGDVSVTQLDELDAEAVSDLPEGVRGLAVKPNRTGIASAPAATQRKLNAATRAQRQAEAELRELQASAGEGLAVVDPEFVSKVDAAQAKLAKANAEVFDITQRKSTDLVVSAKNVMDVDKRQAASTTSAAAIGNPVDDIHAKVKGVADAIHGTAAEFDEAAEMAADMAPELKRIAKQLRDSGGNVSAATTRQLQRQGYDGVRFLEKDGSEKLILFAREDGTLPVARIARATDSPPLARAGKGTHVRAATEEAYAAVRHAKDAKDLPGGSASWLEQQIRDVADLPIDQANAELHARMGAMGVDIAGDVLEPDYLKALGKHQYATARRITQRMLGKASRNLESLGLTSSVLNGKLVALDKYRFALENEQVLDKLSYYAQGVKEASQRMNLFQQEKVKDLLDQARAAADALQYHYSAFDDVMNASDPAVLKALQVGRRVDVMAEGAHIPLDLARINKRATDLGDGLWLVTQEDGSRIIYATKSMGQAAQEGFDEVPFGTTRVPAGMVRVTHETKASSVKSIRGRGVDIAKESPEAARGAFAFADDAATLRRLRGGADGVPADRRVIEAIVPEDRVATVEGINGVVVKDGIRPEEIVTVHTPGREVVTGFRQIAPDGKVAAMYDATNGVADRLLREHLALDGVLDAEDPMVAFAQFAGRQGVVGPAEKRLAGKLNESDLVGQMSRRASESARAFEKANADLEAGIREVERIQTLAKTESARAQVAIIPATETSLNAAGFERLDIPGFNDVAMPTVMAQEFKRAVQGFKGIEGIHRDFRRFNSWWKGWATYMNPSFHIRNMYGAWFNNMLGGVDISDYVMARRVRMAARNSEKWATKRLKDTSDSAVLDGMRRAGQTEMFGLPLDELTYGDLAAMMSSQGVTAGNSVMFGESRIMGEQVALADQGGAGAAIRKLPGGESIVHTLQGAGEMTENVMRTAAYVRGLKQYGTGVEARLFTMMRHGDYADLTDFEFGAIRDLVPFYKWMRTNTPLQVHTLLEKPGILLGVAKAQNAVFTAAGMDYDEEKYRMPKWMGESFIVPLPDLDKDGVYETWSLDIPMSDLHKGVGDYMSSFLPLVMPAIENYVVHEDMFTGAPITGEKVKLAGVFNLPGIRDVLDVVGLAEKGADGMYTTDQNKNLLGMLPMVSRFSPWLYDDADRASVRANSILSAALGVRPRAVDEQTMTQAEMDFYYSQVVPAMDHLRQMGYPLPTTSELEATLGSVQQVLAAQGITARPTESPTSVAA